MACAICETRRPKRFCPGVRGDICTICCGTEREVTVHCPLDCVFLIDARKHDKVPPVDPDQFPNRDIRVTDQFLHDNEDLLVLLSRDLTAAALEPPGAVDADVREALDALIRTYRTLESGIYYETRPQSAMAAALYAHLQNAVAALQKMETEARGVPQTRDRQVLGALVFLQRLELDRNNGRKLGRAFIDFLRGFFHQAEGESLPDVSSLIVP
jgi:hypothetical protein